MKKYFNITKVADTEHSASHLKVDLSYSIGGYNSRRGYYAYVTPVTVKKEVGYNSESSMVFDGFKVMIKEVKRKSAKAETEANGLVFDNLEAIKAMVRNQMADKYEIDWNEVEV